MTRYKGLGVILISCLCHSPFFLQTGVAFDGRETGAFHRANVYYEEGNYDEAIKQYGSIVESGMESGNLYYNLGNCYFKKGALGEALLNYEKARRLMPLDKDLESNYEYARSLIKGAVIVTRQGLPLRVLRAASGRFTIDGLTMVLSTLYLLMLAGIVTGLFSRACRKYAFSLAVLAGLLCIAGVIGLRGKIVLLDREAIVITGQTDAKFEPMDKATTHFTLYEGMKVEVVSSEDNWFKVRRKDDKIGWVEKNALAIF